MKLIDKSAVVAEIERRMKIAEKRLDINNSYSEEGNAAWERDEALYYAYNSLLSSLNTLEVKEVDEEQERMNGCPYRQVGCTMYEGHVLECTGACSWVVDYPKLKELKAQKGEKV